MDTYGVSHSKIGEYTFFAHILFFFSNLIMFSFPASWDIIDT